MKKYLAVVTVLKTTYMKRDNPEDSSDGNSSLRSKKYSNPLFQIKNIKLKNVHKTIIRQTDINHISSNMSYRYDRSSNDGCVMIFVRVQFISKLLTKAYFRSDIKGLFVRLTIHTATVKISYLHEILINR